MTTLIPKPKALLPELPKLIPLSDRLTRFLNRLQPSPEALILILAVCIGGGAGLAIVLFHFLIDWCETLAFEHLLGSISAWGLWTIAVIPALGGLVVGLMTWGFRDWLGQSFSALLNSSGAQKISPLRPCIKMFAAAVSLGTGASLGPEGPSVEIGSNIGFLFGQLFQVSRERYRLLLGAGAAAGLAAGFNAPIAGVFFALEVVLGATFTTPAVSLILLSSIVPALIARIAFGVHPAFDLPAYQVLSHWEWILYLGLGLLASLVSIAFSQAIKLIQAVFQGKIGGLTWLGGLPKPIQPILGGVCIGLVALQLPQVLGIGYGTLQVILEGKEFPLQFLCLLLFVKLVATAVSLGSGFVGGIFAPAMFLGACLGAVYGNVLAIALPSTWLEIAPPPAYAMVGMAAVLAGTVGAPLTAILLLFELTQNYLIILPLMAAVGVSVWGVNQFKSIPSIQGLNLQQMGMNLEKQDELEVLQKVAIASILDRSYLALPDSMVWLEAGQRMVEAKSNTALILDSKQELVGVISLVDIKQNIDQTTQYPTHSSKFQRTLREICTADVVSAYEDESVTEALCRMEARGLFLLPVVARENPRQVLGVLERSRIGLAANLAITQAALLPYSDKALLPEVTTSTTVPQEFIEISEQPVLVNPSLSSESLSSENGALSLHQHLTQELADLTQELAELADKTEPSSEEVICKVG
ncbi:MAG: chloride channel protein [Leptolyngbyaceae cyanobacterium RM2_2_4]|nr:chloride channel protein [Leptolyngbyaceae cyanobacterium SM1_4_3]NJO48527.1 chloride channel protein [Leptolyngbyaceae cyanobacterium RM2_2_4]